MSTHLFDLIILQFSEVVGQKLCRYHSASPLLVKKQQKKEDKILRSFPVRQEKQLEPRSNDCSL